MFAAIRLRHVSVVGYLVAAMAWPVSASTEPAEEYVAKAAFIYNVAQFSTFPEKNSGTMEMCVLGRDPFGPVLNAFVGKSVGVSKLTVRYPKSSADAIKQCRILFISSSEEDNLGAITESAREAGVLTVADTRGAARKGVMVELAIEERRIAFEINNEAARAANIAVSSKVLRLAKAVY